MRLLFLIIVLLLVALFWWPKHGSAPGEETPIGNELEPLRKAQQFESKDYGEALQKHRKQMDDRVAEDGG